MKLPFIFYAVLLLSPFEVMSQLVNPYLPDNTAPPARSGMQLVFSEEFNYEGKPDTAVWRYEKGFVRNNELQWYQSENAKCSEGRLLIEGLRADFPNPLFEAGSNDWKKNRNRVHYTSSSINTKGKLSWLFGRFEIRARIDSTLGSWPAIWTLGVHKEWPSNGEIDLLELYRVKGQPTILANVAWGTDKRFTAKWDSFKKPLSELITEDPDWINKFHVWRMDWTPESIKLYVDDILYNTTFLSETINADGSNPFLHEQYILLNLAIGSAGGNPTNSNFPIIYEIDYVRVYQTSKDSF